MEPLSCWIYFRKHSTVIHFLYFLKHGNCARSWNSSPRKKKTRWSCKHNIFFDRWSGDSSSPGISSHGIAWWRHQMETFSALLAICAGNSPPPGEFPTQRPVTRSFHVYFDLHPNKRLSKQSWGWWFETPSRPLWRHRNGPKYTKIFWFQHQKGLFRLVHWCLLLII